MTGNCCVFKFLRRSVDEKHLMRFHSKTSAVKFLRRSVNRAWVNCSIIIKSLSQSTSGTVNLPNLKCKSCTLSIQLCPKLGLSKRNLSLSLSNPASVMNTTGAFISNCFTYTSNDLTSSTLRDERSKIELLHSFSCFFGGHAIKAIFKEEAPSALAGFLACEYSRLSFAPSHLVAVANERRLYSQATGFHASPLSWSNWNLEMLVFVEGGKPENLKNY